jgi:hypothetical protein
MPGYGSIDTMANRVFQQRRRRDALRFTVLCTHIGAGTDELERGDFVEVEARDLEAYLDRLATRATAD